MYFVNLDEIKSESIYTDTKAILEGYPSAVSQLGKPLVYPSTNAYIDWRTTGMFNEGKNAQVSYKCVDAPCYFT